MFRLVLFCCCSFSALLLSTKLHHRISSLYAGWVCQQSHPCAPLLCLRRPLAQGVYNDLPGCANTPSFLETDVEDARDKEALYGEGRRAVAVLLQRMLSASKHDTVREGTNDTIHGTVYLCITACYRRYLSFEHLPLRGPCLSHENVPSQRIFFHNACACIACTGRACLPVVIDWTLHGLKAFSTMVESYTPSYTRWILERIFSSCMFDRTRAMYCLSMPHEYGYIFSALSCPFLLSPLLRPAPGVHSPACNN